MTDREGTTERVAQPARQDDLIGDLFGPGWPTNRTGGEMVWSHLAYPTGDARTSAIGIEKGVPREVRLNQPFGYQIVVTNLTKTTLDDVVVTDALGDHFKFNSSIPPGQGSGGGLYTWALGSLGPGESRTININGTATSEGTIGSCAEVTYANLLCSSIPVVQPALKLTKTGPSELLKCEEIVYTFQVSNTGSGRVDNVTIADPLPRGLTTADGQSTLTFKAGSLNAGQSKQFTAKVKANAKGRYVNKAMARGDGDVSAQSGDVVTLVREPALKITKTGPERSFIGRTITYEMTVTNTGDGEARNTVVTDPIPAGATFVSASDGGVMNNNVVQWTLGTLRPNASRKVSLTLSSNEATLVRNTATARAFCAEPVSASSQTRYEGIPAVLLEVVDVDDPIEVGKTDVYLITVTNQGSAVGRNIRIVCTLEDEMEYISSEGATRGAARGKTVTFEALPTLAPKAKATWRVSVRALAPGDVRFKVTMTEDALTRPVEETEATNFYR